MRKHFGSNDRDVVILTYVNQQEEPCGAYDESLIPLDSTRDLISDWEVLLRRTTIYLSAWADGIINPRILRKYIDKPNPDWIKLYRFVWFKSQSNYLNVFPTPKTFALATCLDVEAKEEDRRTLIDRTVLPPGKAKSSDEIQILRSESVIVISDLPFSWKSTKGRNMNDITNVYSVNGDGTTFSTTVHRFTNPALIISFSLATSSQTFWRTQVRKTTSKRHQSTYGLQ